jgi:uncharacterized OB-fold protein
MHDELVPGFESAVPLTVIAVELDEQVELVVVANLLEAKDPQARIGDPVEVTFEDLPDGGSLPQFRPCNGDHR